MFALEYINNCMVLKGAQCLTDGEGEIGSRQKRLIEESLHLSKMLIHESYPGDLLASIKSPPGYLLILIFFKVLAIESFP